MKESWNDRPESNLITFDFADTGAWPSPASERPSDRRNRTTPNSEMLAQVGSSGAARPPILELHGSTEFPLNSDVDVAVAANLCDVERAVAPLNAQCSWALSRSRDFSEFLVQLKVNRDPKEFHGALETCGELEQCRDDLLAAGKSLPLRGGGWILVHPEQYDAAQTWAEWHGALIPQHVLVCQDYEAGVLNAIEDIPCKAKVRVKKKSTVPYAFASMSVTLKHTISIKRTFIDVHIPSSLRSSSSGHCATASTTEAHRGRNPRHA